MAFRSLCAAIFFAAGVAAHAADPRPGILVIAGANASPFDAGLAWPGIIAESHPEWYVHADGDNNRVIGDLLADKSADGKQKTLAEVLAPVDHADVVVLLFGTAEAASKSWDKANDAKLGEQMADLLKRLKADPKTSGAVLLVCTPVPVVDARLDQYSKERFVDADKKQQGEKRAELIAAAFKKAAADSGAQVADVYTWAMADAENGKPGRIVGSIGYMLRDWGHPILAKFMDEQLTKLSPKPKDAAAFDAWKQAFEADRKLDQILSQTCEGTVAHGEALAGKYTAAAGKAPGTTEAPVPAELLTGDSFSIVAMAASKPWTVITPGSEMNNLKANRPQLIVKIDSGDVTIASPAAEWQVISEASPNKVMDAGDFRFNSMKLRNFAVACSKPGDQRWTLIRFPLDAIKGKKVQGATVRITYGPPAFKFTPPANPGDKPKEEPLPESELGDAVLYPVIGPDARWSNSQATWKTRDGVTGWTGGKVDAGKRKEAIEAFLATNPPAPVAERARASLK